MLRPRTSVLNHGALAMVVAAGLALSGCVSSPAVSSGPTGRPVTSPTSPAPTPSTDAPVVDHAIHLVDFGDGPGNLGAFAVSSRYLVRAQPDDVTAVEVIRLVDRKVILRHRPSGGENVITTFAGLAGDRLVLLDANIQDEQTADVGFIVNLATGRQISVSSVRGALTPAPTGAQGVVYPNGDWYYSAQTAGNFENCVGMIDLNTLKATTINCTTRPNTIWYVHPSDGTATWTTLHSGQITGCRSAQGLRVGKPYLLGPANDCDIFDAATLGDWTLWTDQLRNDLEPYILLHAAEGTQTFTLGMMHPQSLVICGGYAYWRAGGQAPESIVRWRPGDVVPQTVLTPDSALLTAASEATLWPAGCNDNVLTIMVTRYHDQDPKATVQVLAVEPDA